MLYSFEKYRIVAKILRFLSLLFFFFTSGKPTNINCNSVMWSYYCHVFNRLYITVSGCQRSWRIIDQCPKIFL